MKIALPFAIVAAVLQASFAKVSNTPKLMQKLAHLRVLRRSSLTGFPPDYRSNVILTEPSQWK